MAIVKSSTPWHPFINAWHQQWFFLKTFHLHKVQSLKLAPTSKRHSLALELVTWVADRSRAGGQHGKPNRCLFVRVLSMKLTPSLECHRTAWRHGGASFLWSPVPAPLQMSHGEFFTASQSLGRQSRKPYYIWGQAPLKLTATAATAKLAEGERERYVHHVYVTAG